MTFATAGSDDDLRVAHLERQILSRLKHGDQLIAGAKAVMRKQPSRQGRTRAETSARKALESYASALNWAEDSPREDEVHQRMDDAGHWVRRTFGCFLHREGRSYSQRCPVALGHNRIGMSVGGVARRVCSLCGEDLSECEHRRGTAYLVPGGAAELGWCRVCLKEAGCEHQADKEYRVGLVAKIMEMDLAEVSVVYKPAHPDARFQSVGVDTEKLAEHLGNQFIPGLPVSCDRCLTPCDGLIRHEGLLHG